MDSDYDDLGAVRRRLEEAMAYAASLPRDCDARRRAARAVAILDRCLQGGDREPHCPGHAAHDAAYGSP